MGKEKGKSKKEKGESRESCTSVATFAFYLFPFAFALASDADLRRLARAATTLFAGLLVVGRTLDVLRQAFLLTRLLEPPKQLLGGLAAATLHLDHRKVL